VTDLFNMISSDEGRPFEHISHSLDYDRFVEDAKEVLDSLVPVEKEIQDEEGNWYQMRVLPYRTVNDRIDGVVFTFVDVTDLKEAQERVEEAKEKLEERVDERTAELAEEKEVVEQKAEQFRQLFRQGPVPGVVADLDGGVILAVNDRYLDVMEYERDELVGQAPPEVGIVGETTWERLLDDIKEDGEAHTRAVTWTAASGEQLDLTVAGSVVEWDGTAAVLLTAVEVPASKTER
jgi:PAS domain S-box-containing protein